MNFNISIHTPSLVLGFIVGVCVGAIFVILFSFARGNNENLKRAVSKITAFSILLFWVFWHMQSATDNWNEVPVMFEAIGGICAGIIIGVDVTEKIKTSFLEAINNFKK